MKKKIEEIKAKNREYDDSEILIYSDKGHALGIQTGKPDDLVDDDYVPYCGECRQPNLLAHQYYYRCFHKDSRKPGEHYSMCC